MILRLLDAGTPVGIRTPNLLVRSQMLYPVELRAHFKKQIYDSLLVKNSKKNVSNLF